MAKKKTLAPVEQESNELCPRCEKIILAAGKVDSIEAMLANQTEFDGAQMVTFLKEGHIVKQASNDREYALRPNPFEKDKRLAVATVDDKGKVLAFWTLSSDEILAENWVLVKLKK